MNVLTNFRQFYWCAFVFASTENRNTKSYQHSNWAILLSKRLHPRATRACSLSMYAINQISPKPVYKASYNFAPLEGIPRTASVGTCLSTLQSHRTIAGPGPDWPDGGAWLPITTQARDTSTRRKKKKQIMCIINIYELLHGCCCCFEAAFPGCPFPLTNQPGRVLLCYEDTTHFHRAGTFHWWTTDHGYAIDYHTHSAHPAQVSRSREREYIKQKAATTTTLKPRGKSTNKNTRHRGKQQLLE